MRKETHLFRNRIHIFRKDIFFFRKQVHFFRKIIFYRRNARRIIAAPIKTCQKNRNRIRIFMMSMIKIMSGDINQNCVDVLRMGNETKLNLRTKTMVL